MIEVGPWISLTVAKAYCAAVDKKYGKKTWLRLASGPAKSATAFFELTKETGRPVKELMDKALSFYGSDWCQEKFNQPFPPITIILGPKCRARLLKECPPVEPQTLEQLDKQASDLVTTLMGSLGLEGALEVVVEGEWPEDKILREAVHKKLESRYSSIGFKRRKPPDSK